MEDCTKCYKFGIVCQGAEKLWGSPDCFKRILEANKSQAVLSNSTDGLCNVRFKVSVEIDWLTPAETTAEMMNRKEHERKVRKEAFELSNRMTEKLLKRVA